MHLIRTLATHLSEALDLPVVLEPSRAQSAAHLRLLAGALTLTELWQDAGQTAESFQAQWDLTLSARLLGGNEDLALLSQGLVLGLRLAELLREPFTLAADRREAIGGGLTLDAEGVVHGATRQEAGFHRLSDDEQSAEARLFLYREDWTLRLTARVEKAHSPPTLVRVLYKPEVAGAGDIFQVPPAD